jgi:hypothetical protein
LSLKEQQLMERIWTISNQIMLYQHWSKYTSDS